MKQTSILRSLCVASIFVATHAAGAQTPRPDWSRVDQAMSRKGQVQPDGVVRYGFPRGDLHVSVGDVQIKPALALGSWVAMKYSSSQSAMMMGDLVLTESEVVPVLAELHHGGVQATALHNHLRGETPRVVYMHILGHADPVMLARTVRSALEKTGTPLEQPSAAPPLAIDLDTAAVDRELGYHGKVNGGVLQFSIPRRERIVMSGRDIPPTMGSATAINFQPLGGGRAAITGDFVMIGAEVDPVARVLEQNKIDITALHSHMIGESPRLLFMHFWATGNATMLAKGLRAAILKTNSGG